MTRALNKYKYKTMMDENEWCAIVALSAELKQLKESNLKLSKSVDQKPKPKVKDGRKDKSKRKEEER